jgi:hypothetical protein
MTFDWDEAEVTNDSPTDEMSNGASGKFDINKSLQQFFLSHRPKE